MELIIILILIAILCEFIDSYLGMMYGTILSPTLIIVGYNPLLVIPSILFSQAIGGFVASWRHNYFGNASFDIKSKDLKIASLIIGLGFLAVILGVFIGTNLPKNGLNTYIGILCIVMGILVLLKRSFKFSWKKIIGVGLISSFNKALSGGGFGPVLASGQIIAGRDGKRAIGTTDFAEAPICLMAFLAWVVMSGISDLKLIFPLTAGAVIGGYLGPMALAKFKSRKKLVIVIGLLVILLGTWTLIKTWA